MSPLKLLIKELHKLDQQLVGFEQRYGVLSETFFVWYQSGEEPDEADWVKDFALWAGTYQLKLRRQEKYRRLITQILAQLLKGGFMRKETPSDVSKNPTDMRPEYDFVTMKGGQRGKYYSAYRAGHTVTVHKSDGTTTKL